MWWRHNDKRLLFLNLNSSLPSVTFTLCSRALVVEGSFNIATAGLSIDFFIQWGWLKYGIAVVYIQVQRMCNLNTNGALYHLFMFSALNYSALKKGFLNSIAIVLWYTKYYAIEFICLTDIRTWIATNGIELTMCHVSDFTKACDEDSYGVHTRRVTVTCKIVEILACGRGFVYPVYSTAADDPAKQWARSLSTLILAYLSLNIPI